MDPKMRINTIKFNFFFIVPTTTEIYTLSLHDALPISAVNTQDSLASVARQKGGLGLFSAFDPTRSEEHTSELQSRRDLVCRLLLEKKKHKSIVALLYNLLFNVLL